MKLFRTPLQTGVSKHTFSLTSQFLTSGSCFADIIGARLNAHKIHTAQNPFGVIYNPDAIHKSMKYALFNEVVPDHTFVENQDLWFNYDFHSTYSSVSRAELSKKLKEIIGATHYFLKDVSAVVITYGTAWVYERADTGEIVANCHKVPTSLFRKSLLTQKKIIESFDTFYKVLKSFSPEAKVILTVSPVRHIKDTLELNAVSKSILRVSTHTLTEKYPDVEYFPAFEIMMDDLRDYRFYKSDMVHPTEEAEDYIWNIFIEKYFDHETRDFFREWDKILSAMAHRPFHPASASHQRFIQSILEKLRELKKIVPVQDEEAYFQSQLNK